MLNVVLKFHSLPKMVIITKLFHLHALLETPFKWSLASSAHVKTKIDKTKHIPLATNSLLHSQQISTEYACISDTTYPKIETSGGHSCLMLFRIQCAEAWTVRKNI